MGRWKEYQIEQDEQIARGYIAPERGKKYLCSSHYSDEFLKDYIKANGIDGVCSYCGKHTNVLDLSDFVEYVGGELADALEDVDNAGLFTEKAFYDDDKEVISGYQRAGGYIAPDDAEYYDTNEEVMEDFSLVSDNDCLNDDLSECLYMERKIRRDPTTMMLSDELSLMWSEFCRLVKGERRFTFFKSPMFENAHPSRSDNGLFDILTELGGVIRAAEGSIPSGTILYRCRPADVGEKVEDFKDITAPPVAAAKANRMSPAGISMFYGSYEETTPYREVQNYTEKPLFYIGRFHTTRELKVIDLSSLKCSFWMPSNWQETVFLIHFHREISKPLKRGETEVEYVPSQIFTEYLRYICSSRDGIPYDGIIYRSSLTGEKNVALFYDNETSASVLALDKIQNQNSSKMNEYYILPINKLLPGDIILMKEYDEMGQLVMEKSQSTFSHATIYLGDTSYAESTTNRGVIANNLQRMLFEHQNDAVVLRLKLPFFDSYLIERAIYRTRDLIGTSYGIWEAVRIAEMERRPKDGQPLSPNRQTCTRLVAQAYHDAGLDIVKNYAYCSPEEILKSDKLVQLPITAQLATKKQIDFANSENPIYDFVEAQYQLLLGAREVTEADLQTIRQISDFIIANPTYDAQLCDVLKKSDYLEIYKLEEKLNPWHYCKERFMEQYKGEEVNVAQGLKRSTLNMMSLYNKNLAELCDSYDTTKLGYIGLLKDLYENLVKQCQERINLADEILSDIDLIFDLK